MKNYQKLFLQWLPFAVIVTVLAGLVYVAVQQNYRQNANDPQIQIAEDTRQAIENGGDPATLNDIKKVDLRKDLAVAVIIFDKDKKVVSSSAVLDGMTPTPPDGVFDFVTKNSSERLTWQPKPGVRIATVMMKTNNDKASFVLVGRSLREVENRINQLIIIVLIAWLVGIVGTAIFILASEILTKPEIKL